MKMLLPMVAAGALVAAAPALASPIAAAPSEGLWLNPRGTVVVRTGECRGRLCGWIVWASTQARADARDSGVDRLIGIELLEDYQPLGPGRWSGSVYVPDIGHRFASTITRVGADAMKVQGCLLRSFICKTQIWQRIATLPDG